MKTPFYLLLALALVASCTQKKTDIKKSQIEKIAKYENYIDSIRKTRVATADEMYELINYYNQYYQTYKKDTLSPLFLYRAAEASLYINQGLKAIGYLKHIEVDYPDFKNMGNVVFLIGFTYENNEKNYESARKYYQKFIDKYPEHPLAKDTKILINNLGKSPEEMIEEFEAANAKNKNN